jgi:hypothetical protein
MSARLLESNAELALRTRKAEKDHEPPLTQKAKIQQEHTAAYAIGDERVEISRADRPKGGGGYRTERCALRDEAEQAMNHWQKIQMLSKRPRRVAPEQRTLIDDALEVMLEPDSTGKNMLLSQKK